MGGIITLNGDYGLTQYRYNRGTADAIDASNATWTVANAGDTMNRYPFLVDNATSGISVYGATIDGTVSMTGEWLQLYVNSAAFMIRDSALAKVYDLRISDAWDALRVAGDSEGFEISNVWVSDVRDDAFENDNPVSGSISDSLFDGVFSGISLGHKNMADARNEVLVLDNVLIRMESYLFKGEMTHQSPFKLESLSPKLQITNTVIAIDDVDHVGQPRLQLAWDKTIASSNNVFLNLSDTPLPADYPTPPAGWTVLQGQAARDYWTTAQQAWVDSRGDVATATTSTEPTPETGASESADAETAHVPSSDLAETSTATELGTGVTLLDTGEIELDGTVFNRLPAGALLRCISKLPGEQVIPTTT